MKASEALKLKERLYEDLKDPAYASAYINEAIGDSDEDDEAAKEETARRRDKQIPRRREWILLGIPRSSFSELEMWN